MSLNIKPLVAPQFLKASFILGAAISGIFWLVMRDVTSNFISIIKYNFLKLIIRNNNFIVVAAILSLSCVRLFSDSLNYSLPIHRISQARVLEWVAIAFSRRSSQPRDRTHVSCVSCFGKRILYCRDTGEAASIALLSFNCRLLILLFPIFSKVFTLS